MRRTHIDLGLEFLDCLNGPGGDNDLSATNLLTLDTTKQRPHVVASFSLMQSKLAA